MTGETSLSFNKLRVPLGVATDGAVRQFEADGKFTLHQVSSDVKSPMWQALIHLLADLKGMQPVGTIRRGSFGICT